MGITKRILALGLGMALLGACATTGPTRPSGADATQAATTQAASTDLPDPQPEPEIQYGAFTEDQLYQAILSELSGQSGDFEDAARRYFRLAFETRDIGIIRRASQFASVAGDMNALVQLGLLWTEVEPEALDPHLMLSYQLLDAGRFEDAANHMADVLDRGGEIDFAAISARTQRMPRDRRARLIENLRELHALYPQQQSIQYAVVELLDQNQQPQDALVELQVLRQNYGETPRALAIEAQLLQRLEQPERALRVLRNGVRQFPAERPLRFTYARMLISTEDYRAARDQFAILLDADPLDYETLYSMALLDVEMENFELALEEFNTLAAAGHRASESNFYMGYVNEQLERLEPAITHYRRVEMSANNFVAAQQQATRFAIQLGRYDEAHDWLVELSRGQPRLESLFANIEANLLMLYEQPERAMVVLQEMLARFPDEADLLFTRVLLHDQRGDMEAAEQDLRHIIRLQPEDSRALNHLGYMLADRTTRFEEALELLERAIAIAPDDPAIIDSLAWVQYKLGRYQESLGNLRRAFAAFPDHEVAAHLGEVLWITGERQEAMQVWRDALQETPDSPIVREAMERLNPDS